VRQRRILDGQGKLVRSRIRLAGSVVLGTGLAAAALAVPAQASAARVPAANHTTIATVSTSLGRVVSTPSGHVMFRFMNDPSDSSTCDASCQAVWPPVMSTKAATAGPGIAAKHLGLAKTGQVTYYHHPLYFYVGDPKAGKTKGDGVVAFGAHWFVVSTTGKPVKPASAGGGGGGGYGGY
jgi:predicted lipoprotein with Yx(FWY)xxD motif